MDDLLQQVPSLKKKFFSYSSYADATIADIIPPEITATAKPLPATTFNTIYLENTVKAFVKKELPVQAQYAPVYAMCSADVNADNNADVVLMGNNEYNRMRLSEYDANFGQVYPGDGKGNFTFLAQFVASLSIKGDVRNAVFINDMLLVGINNHPVEAYQKKNNWIRWIIRKHAVVIGKFLISFFS